MSTVLSNRNGKVISRQVVILKADVLLCTLIN